MITTSTVVILALLLTGCAGKHTQVTRPNVPAPQKGSYIDLEPGWRVSVITPITRSGKLRLDPVPEPKTAAGSERSLSLELSAGADFAGYERSYYTVEGLERGGVRVRFSSAEDVRDGKPTRRREPLVKLFQLPRRARHVRLVYLLRGSQADHNMAILAAIDETNLDSITVATQTDPLNACRSSRLAACQWVPVGVAVRPEKRGGPNDQWKPAR